MLDDYERPSSSVNHHDVISSWILAGILIFGLFMFSMT